MFLKDKPMLNLIRRLRGWKTGAYRMMAEAKDNTGHYFSVYEVRAQTEAEAAQVLAAFLSGLNSELIEVAETTEAKVPFPKSMAVVQLSDRVYLEHAI